MRGVPFDRYFVRLLLDRVAFEYCPFSTPPRFPARLTAKPDARLKFAMLSALSQL
jgi:hypothetical protein